MLCVHRWLGLADALMAKAQPGEREAYLYNAVMVFALWAGTFGFFCQAWSVARLGRGWLLAKLVFLALFWLTVLNLL